MAIGFGALALLATNPLGATVRPDNKTCLDAAPNAETDALAAKFFGLLKSGNATAAMDYVSSLSTLFASKQSDLQLMASQIDGAAKIYGTLNAWDHVESETLGNFSRRDVYLVQHANNVVRWRLYFARTPKGWIIASFNFDDQVQNWY